MKKILFLCDGDNFPNGAFRFMKQIREYETVLAKGLFFTPIGMEQMVSVSFKPAADPYLKLKAVEKIPRHKSPELFLTECENHGIKYQVHPYEGSWDRDLFIKETRFTDMVVISEELFCLDNAEGRPSYFMEEMLRASECPVIVVPENFHKIDRLAVAYDGGKQSMFALKQFIYLFPDYVDLPAEFVHIKNVPEDDIPDLDLLQEYTSSHFESLYASKLHFDPKKYFSTWLENKMNVLLVTGSYSRSTFSNVFRQSFAGDLIARHTCPIFIAHCS